jgi:hypothetical protein
MNKTIGTFLLIYLLLSVVNTYGQKTYEIYKDDSLHFYFKELGTENGFYYNPHNMKDSLDDGIYLFYNVEKKDSLSPKKRIIYRGEYVNNCKNGCFEMNSYFYKKRNKTQKLEYKHVCHYKDGKKDGTEEAYHIEYNIVRSYSVIMSDYSEYKNGELNGLSISYYRGRPTKIIMYEMGEEKEVLMNRILYK